MYLSTDVVDSVRGDAAAFIMDNDRKMYRPFYEEAEKFCVANRVMLGGPIGIAVLLSQPLTPTSPPWNLYIGASGSTFDMAKKFAIAIAAARSPHVPAYTTTLRTDLKHVEYTVLVAARMLFKIHVLDAYRGVALSTIMKPVTRKGYYDHDILVVPAEIQLISVYRDLYSPARFGQWADLRATESALVAEWLGERSGGRRHKARSDQPAQSNPQSFARSFDFIKHLAPDDVLIGDHAASQLGVTGSTSSRVQFISSRSPESICEALNRIETSRSSRGGMQFTHAKLALNIDDWRLTKHTIYVSNGRDQQPIADVFNASAHEMIPVVGAGQHRCAGVYVLLRFSMIDIWSLRIVASLSGKSLDARIAEIQKRVVGLRSLAEADPTARSPREHVGVYTDEIVAKRQYIKSLGPPFRPFYPAKVDGGDDGSDDPATPIPSREIDFTIDPDTKQQILRKVTGRQAASTSAHDMMRRLEAWRREAGVSASSTRSWGIGKTLSAYYYKNAVFLPWIPERIDSYVDIGCGDGLDVVALGQRYRVGTAVCADIADHRDKVAKRASQYVQVELDQPLDIADGTATLVAVFHSLHHMRDNVAARLADIVRIVAPGGRIFIKDHDVTDDETASNVDFEHLAYLITEPAWVDQPIDELVRDFATIEPMAYWSADHIDKIMTDLGTKRLDRREINRRTRVYGAIYERESS